MCEFRADLVQCLFGAFSLVDVDEQAVPADNAPVRIPKRKSARLKPAIDAIETSSADFEVEGDAPDAIDWEQDLDGAWKILRMSYLVGLPVLDLLERLAEVLEDLVVGDFEFTAGREDRDRGGNAVDDQARMAFAFAAAPPPPASGPRCRCSPRTI